MMWVLCVSTTRWALPAERGTVPGSATSTWAETPMLSLMWARSAAARSCGGRRLAGSRSTRTVRLARLAERSTCIWKWGVRPSTLRTSASICEGNTLTPRTINMSSERPVTRSMRRIVRAVPGSSRVRSRVR